MKLLEYHDILNPGMFEKSEALRQAWEDVEHAIALTDWPHGSGSFTIYPESGKKSGEGNGVKLIKDYLKCVFVRVSAGSLGSDPQGLTPLPADSEPS